MNSVILSWLTSLWLYFKQSGVYSLFDKVYRWFQRQWQASKIAGLFRRQGGRGVEKSLLYKVFSFPIVVLEKIKPSVAGAVERSAFLRWAKLCVHNALGLNVRFFAVLGMAFSAGFGISVVLLRHTLPSPVVLAAILVFALCSLCNCNVTAWFKTSRLVKAVSALLDIPFTFDFYDEAQCCGKARLVLAACIGLLGGVASVVAGPLLGLLLVAGFFGGLLCFYSTPFAVFCTVAAAPLLPTMLLAGLCAVCFLSFIARAVTKKDFQWKLDGFTILLISLLLIFGISGALFSVTRGRSLQIWVLYAAFMLMFVVLRHVITQKEQLVALLKIVTCVSAVLALIGYGQYVFGISPENAWVDESMFQDIRVRIYATLENPNVYGEYLLLLLPLNLLCTFLAKNKPAKVFFGLILLLNCGAMVLTQSRGCWLGLLAAAGILVTFLNGRLWGLGLVALLAAPFLLPDSIWSRFTSIGNLSDSSSSYRRFIWLGSVAMLGRYWLTGIGMGEAAFNTVYPSYSYDAAFAQHAHNLFFQLWIENGLLALILFLALVLLFFKQMVAACRGKAKENLFFRGAVCFGAGVTAFLLQGLFDYSFYNYRVLFLFWTVLALGMLWRDFAAAETPQGGEEGLS